MMNLTYMINNESSNFRRKNEVIQCRECRQMPAGAQPSVAATWSVVIPASIAVEPACWQLSKAALQVRLRRTCILLLLHFTAEVAMAVALHL